jgi:hypothetical protein
MGYNLIMNEYYNEETFPEYVRLVQNQPKIYGQDFEPVIFTDVLPNEELQYIKDQFNNVTPENINVQAYNGLGTLSINFLNRKSIIEKIEKMASDAVGEELEVLEVGGNRYSPDFGWYPKFGPHYDARPVEMYVFDYHVQSTENWGLFMEGKRFDFGDNEALLFCGTGRIHWREPIKLKENAKIDLLFFWLQHKSPRAMSKEKTDIMKTRAFLINKKIEAPPLLKKEDWWEKIQISELSNQYPDFKKISLDGSTPLTHNTMYRSPINGKDIFDFYNPDNMNNLESQIVYITEEVKNKVIRFMTHVHAEFDLTFENAYLVKNLVNNESIMKGYENQSNKELVSLMIPLTDNDCKYLINDKPFIVKQHYSLTLSTTHQDCKIILSDQDSRGSDLLFFNFSIMKFN